MFQETPKIDPTVRKSVQVPPDAAQERPESHLSGKGEAAAAADTVPARHGGFESHFLSSRTSAPGIGRGGDFPLASGGGKVNRAATSRCGKPAPPADFAATFEPEAPGSAKEVTFSSTSSTAMLDVSYSLHGWVDALE